MTRKTTAITTTTTLILAIFALVGGAIITTGVLLQTPAAVYAQLSDVEDIIDDSLEIAGVDAELNQDQSQILGQDSLGDFGEDNADLDDANVAIPIAVPINVDEEEEEVVEEPDDGVPPPEEDAFFCITVAEGPACFESLTECQEAADIFQTEDECQRFETLPEGAALCTVEEGQIICQV